MKKSIIPLVESAECGYLKSFPSFQQHKDSLQALLEHIQPYPLTYSILERYADIRRFLRPLHKDIGDIDTLIAATAIEHHLTLITIDRDFDRVPQLACKFVHLKAA